MVRFWLGPQKVENHLGGLPTSQRWRKKQGRCIKLLSLVFIGFISAKDSARDIGTHPSQVQIKERYTQDDILRKLLAGLEKPVKHRTFISYHHSLDQGYYDAFSKHFHDTLEAIHDKSLDKEIDSDNVDYVMRKIREEYLTGTSCTIVLIGAETDTRKYIDWEIKATLDKKHALIGVYLPTAKRSADGTKIIVPDRLHDNCVSGFASLLSWEAITASADALDGYIKAAKEKSVSLIDNSREKKTKNG